MKIKTAIFVMFFSVCFFAVDVCADTRFVNTRTGTHESFTRIVFDSEGAYPISIEHDPENTVDIRYKNLIITEEEGINLKKQIEKVTDTIIYRDNNISHLKLLPRSVGIQIKTSYLPSNIQENIDYRLVIDLYPEGEIIGAEKTTVSKLALAKNEFTSDSSIVKKNEVHYSAVSGINTKQENTQILPGSTSGENSLESHEINDVVNPESKKKQNPELVLAKNVVEIDKSVKVNKENGPDEPLEKKDLSGKAEIVLRNTNGEEDSSKFNEYSDKAQSVTGNLEINRVRENSSEIHINMNDIGQEDQSAILKGMLYKTAKVKMEYTELPHRYQYSARTLYSGIGTGNLTLDDTIQGVLASTPFSDLDNNLSAFFSNAISGNPTVTRKKGYINIEWIKSDPFRFNVELKKEKREGTIPRLGALGFNNTVELLEPVNHDSTQLRLQGEYSKGSIYLSTSYFLSAFKNDIKTLAWDNPLALNDSLFNPSRGLMSLAPDNNYHNLSMSGSIRNLPYYTRITASAAVGWMRQDENLAPFTINSVVDAPPVPVDNIDGEVKTRLLNLMITSNPFNSFNLKIKYNSYEHENNTTPITFPGYVDTDSFFIDTPVINIPSSYKKNTLDAGLRKDLFKDTRLGFNYTWNNMKRDNREVSEQDDQGFKVTIDTSALAWLFLRTSYEKVNRDTKNYVFDRYLVSGEDLNQNPLLRKYDEADMIRDRIQFNVDLTSWDKLGLGLSYIYGQDDFDNSTYGLLEDKHHIFSFDADYAFSDNTSLHAFYSNERYQNLSAGSDFSGDWTVTGEDRVNTIGADLRTKLFIDDLNLDISYSYSKADGNLDFASSGDGYSVFNNVDESIFHILKAALKYRAGEKWACSLGYLWEKANYSDYNKEGFTFVPSDGSPIGFYQGALLMGIIPQDYNVNQLYFKISHYF